MQGILRAGTVLIGILFLLISAAFLFAPTLAAGGFGISPAGNQGLATLRVDMTSLFAALGALLAWGGWTSDRRALNFVAGLMVVALVGRAVSRVADGAYASWWQPALIELAALVFAFSYSRSVAARKP